MDRKGSLSEKRQREREIKANRYVGAILGGGARLEETLENLKFEPSPVVQMVLSRLIRRDGGYKIVGNLFPTNLKYFNQHPPTPYTNSLSSELSWAAEVLLNFPAEINEFLKQKAALERRLLANNLSAAEAVLDQISKTSQSIWALENRFLIAELQGGVEANKRLLSDLVEDNPHLVSNILLQCLSSRVERKVTPGALDEQIAGLSTSDDERIQNLLWYLRFRSNFQSVRDFDRLAFAVWYEGRHSIFDLYLGFIRVLQVVASDRRLNQDVLSLRSLLRRFKSVFEDPRLDLLTAFYEPSVVPPATSMQQIIIKTADAYTRGDYSVVKGAVVRGLLESPDIFEFYEFYIKAVLHAGELGPDAPEGPLLRQEILFHLDHVLRKDAQTEKSLQSLLKLSQMLDGTQIGDQLYAFYVAQAVPKHPLRPDIFGALSSAAPTARLANMYDVPAFAVTYLEALAKVIGGHTSIGFFREVMISALQGTQLPDQSDIPEGRLKKYQAWVLSRIGRKAEAADLFQKILDTRRSDPILAQDAATALYRIYLSLDDLDACVSLVVQLYLTWKELLFPIPLRELVERYESDEATQRRGHIGWPILYLIYYSENRLTKDNYKVFTAYDNFLSAHEMVVPSQLLSKPNDATDESLIYFLKNVCVPEVMDYSAEISGSEALELERIKVCQRLMDLDKAHAEVYSEEIRNLTRQSMIRRAIQQVDEGKIYVDVPRIKELLERSFKDKFERLRELSRIRDTRARKVLLFSVVGLESNKPSVFYTGEGLEIFRQLFMEVRSHFISNNEYGLDSYISLRIRHGTLSAQIRSAFETHSLITRTVKVGEYASNKYWRDRLSLNFPAAVVDAVDKRLAKLSAEIDVVIETVKSRWLQIKQKQNDFEGLFDFDYSGVELLQLYTAFGEENDYEAFLKNAFDALWSRTHTILKDIQQKVQGILRYDLLFTLQRFENDLGAIDGGLRSVFQDAIAQCRTDIGTCVRLVAKWFSVSDKKELPDYEFEHLIMTALEYIQRLFPAAEFEPTVEVQKTLKFKGWTFPYFSDIAFILFENIVHHSDGRPIKAQISVWLDGTTLNLIVRNSPVSESIEDIKSKLDKQLKSSEDAMTTEGGTGFLKLKKVLSRDLRIHNPGFKVNFPEDQFEVVITIDVSGALS